MGTDSAMKPTQRIEAKDATGIGIRAPTRGYLFIELLPAESSEEIFPSVGSLQVNDLPSSGGMVDEVVEARFPDGRRFFCVSFKGDLEGWSNLVMAHCKASGRSWGQPFSDHMLVRPEGEELLWTQSELWSD